MRILQVNKFLWQCAGPERYMLEIAAMLKRRGHSLAFFAMSDRRNLPSDCDRYFVSEIRYDTASLWHTSRTALKAVGRTVYSLESKRKMKALVQAKRPEVAHLHGINRQISPSILPVLKRSGVPVIQTVHNAEFICPALHLYIEHRREICQRCLNGKYYHAFVHRCVKGSWAASGLSVLAQYVHRICRIRQRCIDLFVCPSRFLAGKLVEAGIPEDRVRHLPNYVDPASYEPNYDPGRYGVYAGRLSPEKGLPTLLKAAALAREVPLVIAGEGNEEETIRRSVDEHRLGNVRLVGYQQGDELKKTMRDAAFVVVPSECYENSPMAIYEGSALGKPTVASRIGGIPELVDPGATGLLFEPRNAEQLADAMQQLHRDPQSCREMGRRAREKIAEICDGHYDRLMQLYQEAVHMHDKGHMHDNGKTKDIGDTLAERPVDFRQSYDASTASESHRTNLGTRT